MRHRKKNKIIDRNAAQLRGLTKSLITAVIIHERVTTTEAKAKLIKPAIERLISLGKKNTLAARRLIMARTGSHNVAKKILTVTAPRYAQRSGGYTRIIKIGQRQGDGARLVYLALV
jgi:large subunit ribosomal protein L17